MRGRPRTLPAHRRLRLAMVILGVTLGAEVVGGLLFGSLSLLSDAAHVLSDILALLLASLALTYAHRRVPSERMTYGYHRLEVFSALLNGVALVGIAVWIVIEAIDRLGGVQNLRAGPAFLIATVGLVVNLVVAWSLRGGEVERRDLNLRSAYLHVLGDALSSVAVMVGLGVAWVGDLPWLDPAVAILVSLIILVGAGRVLAEGAGILLQQSPHDVEELRALVRSVDRVEDIKDVRLWQVCSWLIVGTAHVVIDAERLEETEPIREEIEMLLRERYGVRHLTLHFETRAMAESHTHRIDHQHIVPVESQK